MVSIKINSEILPLSHPQKFLLIERSFCHSPQREGALCGLCRCITSEVFSAIHYGCVLVPLWRDPQATAFLYYLNRIAPTSGLLIGANYPDLAGEIPA